ncbi:MAG: aminoglycoside phosphotransferase family protein [Bacillota bacterium]|nr:aminoglycoside phosphotransferase family protein [Bacillota bacterium]
MSENNKKLRIDEALVSRLVTTQFPQWKDLTIRPVALSGWDNRTFHLGEYMLVRMPSAASYAAQVEKEQQWLPKLAPLLPLPIPVPLAVGEPTEGYPWSWSIYRWLEGESAASTPIADLCDFASSLAQFLLALHRIDSTGGPVAGPHSFYRGGPLKTYDVETRQAIMSLKGKIDVDTAIEVWETALATTWHGSPVWIHGDISVGNLLVQEGKLCAVIDFGQLAVGDPACDLAIAWTLFEGKSRDIFRTLLLLDPGTWARGRAWTLWKALIMAASLTDSNAVEAREPWRIIDEVLADHKQSSLLKE